MVSSNAALVPILVVACSSSAPASSTSVGAPSAVAEPPPSHAAPDPAPVASASAPSPAPSVAPICVPGRTAVGLFDGNVWFCPAGGHERRLTSTGKDGEPTVSPGATRVAFVRDAGRERVPLTENDTIEIRDARILVVDVATDTEREVAKNGTCRSLAHPLFLDERFLVLRAFGLEAPTVHNKSICLVDTETGAMKTIAPRSLCAMPIRTGKYAGMVFVGGADFKVGQGLTDWYAIVRTDGTQVKKRDDNPFDRDYDGDGARDSVEQDAGCDVPPDTIRPGVEAIEAKL